MATITIELWVDENGNVRGVIDGNESHDDLVQEYAIRKVVLNVEVPEPEAKEVNVEVPADVNAPLNIKAT